MSNLDSDNIGGVDPYALVPGTGSNMFRNERVNEQNRKRKALLAEQAALPKGVKGVVTELQKLLAEAKAENDSFGSYSRTMFGQGKKPDAQSIEVEWRAREMHLELITRLEKCLAKYQTPKPL